MWLLKICFLKSFMQLFVLQIIYVTVTSVVMLTHINAAPIVMAVAAIPGAILGGIAVQMHLLHNGNATVNIHS